MQEMGVGFPTAADCRWETGDHLPVRSASERKPDFNCLIQAQSLAWSIDVTLPPVKTTRIRSSDSSL